MCRMWLPLCLLALTVPVATAAAARPAAFHVTIHATMDIQATYPAGSGCTENLARHVEIRNAAPLTLTADRLGKTKNSTFDLVATETRSDSYTGACPNEFPTGSCGAVTYTIPSIGTGVGFLTRTSNQFILFYSRISTDPYHGECGGHLWGVAEEPGSAGKVWNDAFPPNGLPGWFHGPAGPKGATVNRAKLTARKRFVVQWSASGQYQEGQTLYGDVVEQIAAGWQVTLVPAS